MTTPATATQGLLQHQEALEGAIASAEADANGRTIEVLNRSQAKLKDLEDELKFMYSEKSKIDGLIARGKESLKKLETIIARDEANSEDLAKAIRSNLSAVDSLRKDGIELPNP